MRGELAGRPRLGLLAAASACAPPLAAVWIGPDFAMQHFGRLLGMVLLWAMLGAFVFLAVAHLLRACRACRQGRMRLDQSGAAMAEFAIAVVPFFLLLFGLIQLALASMARVLVSYSAFCAARAAVVLVPARLESSQSAAGEGFVAEAANQVGAGSRQLNDSRRSGKLARIREAASYALVPASPPLDELTTAATAVDRALDARLPHGGVVDALVRGERKLRYAQLATWVTLHDSRTGSLRSTFAWNSPIRARVTYLFLCRMPIAGRLIGRPLPVLLAQLATLPFEPDRAVLLGARGSFLVLTAEHTLVNQGAPR